jgi:FAD/FMN-containing dehydrogenase
MTTADELATGVALPADPGYEAAAAVFNLAAPATPAAAVTVRTVGQIRDAIRYAQEHGLPVRVHATGHASAAVRPVDGTLLIRTELAGYAGGVAIDAANRTARIPAGTRWGEVVEAAAPHGLAAPHGSSPSVGAVGYLLRGGLSCYGRKAGLAVNSIRAIELVTADGDFHRVDASHDPELFWALRGGGGGFGVVTAVEIDLFPASAVVTGAAYWPAVHAAQLMSIWQNWTEHAPWEVTTSVRVMNLPEHPQVPPELSGRTLFCVDGAVLVTGDPDAAQAHAADLLGPLRAVAPPLADSWELTTTAAVLQAHMDPDEPVSIVGDHMLLGEIGDEGAAAFLRLTGEGSGSPLIVAGLRQLGGAYAVPQPGKGALDHLDARYSYAASGALFPPMTEDVLSDYLAKVRTALSPWDTGRTVPSFVEHFAQPQGHLRPDQVAAADAVRSRIDPHGLFRGDIAPNATAAP